MRRKPCPGNNSRFAAVSGGSSLNARVNSIIVGVSFAAKMRLVRAFDGKRRAT